MIGNHNRCITVIDGESSRVVFCNFQIYIFTKTQKDEWKLKIKTILGK